MSAMLNRLPIQLERNPKRVITRLFLPGDQNRIRDIIERVCAFSAGEVKTMLAQLQRSFQTLHPDIEDVFLKHFEAVEDFLPRNSSGRPIAATYRCLLHHGIRDRVGGTFQSFHGAVR